MSALEDMAVMSRLIVAFPELDRRDQVDDPLSLYRAITLAEEIGSALAVVRVAHAQWLVKLARAEHAGLKK